MVFNPGFINLHHFRRKMTLQSVSAKAPIVTARIKNIAAVINMVLLILIVLNLLLLTNNQLISFINKRLKMEI